MNKKPICNENDRREMQRDWATVAKILNDMACSAKMASEVLGGTAEIPCTRDYYTAYVADFFTDKEFLDNIVGDAWAFDKDQKEIHGWDYYRREL